MPLAFCSALLPTSLQPSSLPLSPSCRRGASFLPLTRELRREAKDVQRRNKNPAQEQVYGCCFSLARPKAVAPRRIIPCPRLKHSIASQRVRGRKAREDAQRASAPDEAAG